VRTRTTAAVGLAGIVATSLTGFSTATGAAPDAPSASMRIVDAVSACADLAGLSIDADLIALPTQGAVLDTTELVEAVDAADQPEYCRVRGRVIGADPQAPPINFQLNLPTDWNRGSVQFGGGGFNGVVVTATGNVPGTGGAPHAPASPLQRGYVTFGGDSGNAVGSDPAGSFALNEESLENYAGDSVKRMRDAVMPAISTYYGQVPERQYFAGGSKGGHEGLVAAQRFGADYDGIIAYYPANQNQAMVISWYNIAQKWNRPGGSLNAAEQQLLADSAMATCDGLDGLADGVIANTAGCDDAFDVTELRCPGGADTADDCLSQTQLGTIKAAAEPFRFAFELANGVREIGPYPVFHGAGLTNGAVGGYLGFAEPVIKYFVTQDADADTAAFDYRDHEQRVKKLSRLLDATDPDIDRFVAGGGKLIMVQGTTDHLVAHPVTTALVERMQQRYGAGSREFLRYYVQPGYGHGGGDFNLSWDSLSALEDWAEQGAAPVNPIATDANSGASRQMPLCAYPTFPRYVGGSPAAASSFTCAAATTNPTKAPSHLTIKPKKKRVKAGTKAVFRVSVTAAVTSVTGTVTVKVAGRKRSAALNAKGTASVKIKVKKGTKPGPKKVKAAYSGDAKVAGSRATTTVKVTR